MRKRILALFCVCVMLLFFVPFAFASSANQTYISKSTFWSWLVGMGGVPQKMVGYLTLSGCPDSPDGRHHAKSYKHEAKYSYYSCICFYCGESFIAYAEDMETELTQGYNNYVSTLPAQSIDIDGALYWSPQIEYNSP